MDHAFAGRTLAACAVIALVLAGVQLIARASLRLRLERGSGGKLLALVETTYLPNASSLHVIRAGDRYFVLGRSGTHIATLCEIPAERVTASLARPAAALVARGPLAGLVSRLRRRAHR